MDPARTDAELLAAFTGGETAAFEELVRRHQDRLWAVAIRTVADRQDAADALQDALISAMRAAPSFRGDAAVTTWLHRIVVNSCVDRIRRRRSRPTVPLPEPGPDELAETGDRVAELETAIIVRAALERLPAEQQAALVLVDIEGYPVARAAEILSVAEGTVKSRCARGRARLAVLLGHLRQPDDLPSDDLPSDGLSDGLSHGGRTGGRTGGRNPGAAENVRPAIQAGPGRDEGEGAAG
jgi:RNA polymerase sigma-70 factor (ECF subfamily)